MKIPTNCICTLAFFILLLGVSHAAEPAKVAPWRFAVLGDTRSDPCAADGKSGVNSTVLRRIADAVAKEKPDLVLVPGDLVLGQSHKCSPAEPLATQLKNWRQAMSPVYTAGIPVLPVRGNHEYLSPDYFPSDPCRPLRPNPEALQAWLEVFGNDVPENGPDGQKGVTFAYPHKNALFIGLDELTKFLSYDAVWLDKTLQGNKRQHLFVYGHYPAFAVYHADSLSCNTTARDALWNTIGANNGRMYFCGHDHFYDRGEAPAAGNVVSQMLVGNGGAPFYNYTGTYKDPKLKPAKRILAKPGFLLVTVDGAKVTAVLNTIDGEKITPADTLEYTIAMTSRPERKGSMTGLPLSRK